MVPESTSNMVMVWLHGIESAKDCICLCCAPAFLVLVRGFFGIAERGPEDGNGIAKAANEHKDNHTSCDSER
jgi:hypothetical protein